MATNNDNIDISEIEKNLIKTLYTIMSYDFSIYFTPNEDDSPPQLSPEPECTSGVPDHTIQFGDFQRVIQRELNYAI